MSEGKDTVVTRLMLENEQLRAELCFMHGEAERLAKANAAKTLAQDAAREEARRLAKVNTDYALELAQLHKTAARLDKANSDLFRANLVFRAEKEHLQREIEDVRAQRDLIADQVDQRQASITLLAKACGEAVGPDWRASGSGLEHARKLAEDATREIRALRRLPYRSGNDTTVRVMVQDTLRRAEGLGLLNVNNVASDPADKRTIERLWRVIERLLADDEPEVSARRTAEEAAADAGRAFTSALWGTRTGDATAAGEALKKALIVWEEGSGE